MKIGILGTGAYGLALANVLNDNKNNITMWTRFEEEKEELETKRQKEKAIKDYIIPSEIKFTTNLENVIKDKDFIIIAIPAAFVLDLIKEMIPFIKNNHILIATKGIENETGLFINEIIEKYLDTKNIAVISGPTFAKDIVTRNPVGLSIASKNEATIDIVKKAFCNKYLKLRQTDDVIGVETCGAIKNIIALASGMLNGLGANESTKAMLITEAIHDMKLILETFDADPKTIMSFAGIGDLLLTCNSTQSRNFSFGKLIGQEETKENIEKYLKENTVEGLYTLKSVYKLLKNNKIEIPIIDLIYDIIIKGEHPNKLLTFLVEKE